MNTVSLRVNDQDDYLSSTMDIAALAADVSCEICSLIRWTSESTCHEGWRTLRSKSLFPNWYWQVKQNWSCPYPLYLRSFIIAIWTWFCYTAALARRCAHRCGGRPLGPVGILEWPRRRGDNGAGFTWARRYSVRGDPHQISLQWCSWSWHLVCLHLYNGAQA